MIRANSLFALALLLGFVAVGYAFKQESPSGGPQMEAAAQRLLKALTPEQRAAATLDYSAAQRLDWHFIPKNERKGLQLRDMNEQQRQLARNLLASCLSEVGYHKATTIMNLEQILEKLEGDRGRFRRDYLRYYFTIFGTPGEGKWGLSIEGHHLSLNFVVEDGRIVAHTPAFFGANPAEVRSNVGVGPAQGTRILAQEELLGFELVNSLSDEQRRTAIIAEKAPSDIRAGGEPQPPQTEPEGIAAAKLTSDQKATLKKLIEVYANNMPRRTAEQELAKIDEAGFDKVHFAWAGALKPGVGHYYRVQGPSFLIEFVNVQPDSAGNPANHIHSVWRDMKGDFAIPIGKN
jgi:hypothetical protein